MENDAQTLQFTVFRNWNNAITITWPVYCWLESSIYWSSVV